MDVERLQVRAYRALPRRLRVPATRWATPNFTIGSMAWLTDDGCRVLLSRSSYRRGWLPTGGFVKKGETPLETVTREVREELGTTAELRTHHRVAFDVQRRSITFVSVGRIAPGVALVLSSEILETQWFALDEVPEFPRDFHEGMTEDDLAAIRQLA